MQPFFSPEKLHAERNKRLEIILLNKKIAKVAKELSELIENRDCLENYSSHSSSTHYHIVDIIEKASRSNGHFTTFLAEPLENLSGQFDAKYWPKIHEVIGEIAEDADRSNVQCTNPVVAAGTNSIRSSQADYLKALWVLLDEHRGQRYHFELPRKFELSDSALATILNCTLNLGVDEMKDSQYVKNLRKRMRDNEILSV